MTKLDDAGARQTIADNYYVAAGRPSAKDPAHVASEQEQAALDYLNAQADQYRL
jgi:hypothetical protein